jgi:chromosome segregation ATPase
VWCVQVTALERELSEVRLLSANRLETIQRLESECESLRTQVHELQQMRVHIPEEVLRQQPLFRSAQDRIIALENELSTLHTQLEVQRKELADVHEMRKLAESRRSEQEMTHIKKTLQSKLDAMEFDVKRYHAERDEYRHKWELLQRTAQQTSASTQLQALITSLQNQCEKLKEENTNLKKELSQVKVELAEYTLKSERTTQEALEAKIHECHELTERMRRQQKVITDLQQRLNSISTATSSTTSMTPTSSSSSSSSAAAAAAAAVAVNSGYVDLKNSTDPGLPSFPSASSTAVGSDVSGTELNATSQWQLERQELLTKLSRLERLNRELQKKVDTQKKEGEGLISEIEAISKEFETIQAQNVRLAHQLAEKEDANLHLISERVKANHTQQTLTKEKELLNEKINELHTQNQLNIELLNAQTRKVAVLEEQIVCSRNSRLILSSLSSLSFLFLPFVHNY